MDQVKQQKIKTAISPTRAENYPEWYQQVIKAADLAENSPVRGCMVIKPYGYAIWEHIQRALDDLFKSTGHVNAYFPLLIPLSFLQREAAHVEGFAKECAVVTHHRLSADEKTGRLIPTGELEEPLIIRPTSETIIGHFYAKWVQSYRDLPILINQWANVMRWELRPRLFLRTSEFLWQEGHTAHATEAEAIEETLRMLDIYEKFAHEFMACPVIKGMKTEDERFPGAVETYTIEAMMQDRKALQGGTSHFLGQNFAKASEINFLDKDGERRYAWTTSWGVTTRLIGGMVMMHSDDDGLILPPRLAPIHIVLIPIFKNEEEKAQVLSYCEELRRTWTSLTYAQGAVRVHVDKRDHLTGGERGWDHIKKGVPLRVEIGPREAKEGKVFFGRRDQGPKDKKSMSAAEFSSSVTALLGEIQSWLYNRAVQNLSSNLKRIDTLAEFESFFSPRDLKNEDSEIFGGFALCHWSPAAIGHEVLKKLKVTPRCIPLAHSSLNLGSEEKGLCVFTGKPSQRRVIFARSY
ncbi:MAG: proline--tRNA ligase [Oligoflexales bacterium]|nr:proline--tRNA ligase [Oligoflexales bacterium]